MEDLLYFRSKPSMKGTVQFCNKELVASSFHVSGLLFVTLQPYILDLREKC